VEEGDYRGLVQVIGHLLAVKERQNTTDTMFEPLQQTIALLKVYEQELPEVVYKQLAVRSELLSHILCYVLNHFSSFYLQPPVTNLWCELFCPPRCLFFLSI